MAKQVCDKSRLAALFAVCDSKSLEAAAKAQSGVVKLSKAAIAASLATVAALHLAAWKIQGNEESELPTDPEKLKSARNSFAGGIRRDVDRALIRGSVLRIGDNEVTGPEWMESLKLEVKDAAERIRKSKLGNGNSIVRKGPELPLPTDIESSGQRGRQACDPLAEMMAFCTK